MDNLHLKHQEMQHRLRKEIILSQAHLPNHHLQLTKCRIIHHQSLTIYHLLMQVTDPHQGFLLISIWVDQVFLLQ
jgi:hypothetical protein